MSNNTSLIKVGMSVQLYPRDKHKKFAKLLEITPNGWIFQYIKGTSPESGHNLGDIEFVSFNNLLRFNIL